MVIPRKGLAHKHTVNESSHPGRSYFLVRDYWRNSCLYVRQCHDGLLIQQVQTLLVLRHLTSLGQYRTLEELHSYINFRPVKTMVSNSLGKVRPITQPEYKVFVDVNHHFFRENDSHKNKGDYLCTSLQALSGQLHSSALLFQKALGYLASLEILFIMATLGYVCYSSN